MKTLKKAAAAALIFTSAMVALALHTAAYIDPSIVTYIFSVAAGIVVAGGAGVAIYWKRIKLFFKKRADKKNQNTTAATPPAPQETTPPPENDNLAD